MKRRRHIKIVAVFSFIIFVSFNILGYPLLHEVMGLNKKPPCKSYDNSVNNPPCQPSRPVGPTIIDINSYYSYWSCSTDPDGDKIHYIWCFDDSCDCCTNIYASGEGSTIDHCWANYGLFRVQVMAMDEHGAYSQWSDPLYVAVTTHGLSY